MQLGMFDSSQVLGTRSGFPAVHELRFQVIRVTLHWGDDRRGRGRRRWTLRRPGSIRWSTGQRLRLRRRLATPTRPTSVSCSRSSTPRAGQTGTKVQRVPTQDDRPRATSPTPPPRATAAFVHPAGRSDALAPPVRSGLPGTRPKSPFSSRPSTPAREMGVISPGHYAKICSAIFTGVHPDDAVGQGRLRRDGPRGNNHPQSSRPSEPDSVHPGHEGRASDSTPSRTIRIQAPVRDAQEAAELEGPDRPRQHRRSGEGADQALRLQASLDHRVRLSDEPARTAPSASRRRSRPRT